MEKDGGEFLAEFWGFAPNTFEGRFAAVSSRLGLDQGLRAKDLRLLYQATFYATLCNIAFNGLGPYDGEIKPEKELHRIELEQQYMAARHEFLATDGWSGLTVNQQESIGGVLLNVRVSEANLAE